MLQDGAYYHVVARANRKFMILGTPRMKELFQNVITRAKTKYSFRIENFCIMGNHFHFIIQPGPGESLSRIMQWILSRFATAFNKASGYTGHVWGERFFSQILHRLRDFLHVFTYIDNNPVMAGLVYEAEDWQYGGLRQAREGNYAVVDRLPAWLVCWFPRHQQFLLALNN